VLHLTGNSMTSQGACHIGKALLTNKALLKLFISASSIGVEGAASLADALVATAVASPSSRAEEEEDPAIREMTAIMNSQSISAEFAGFEFDKREQTFGLEWLYLSQNKIGDAGVQHIANAMKVNRGLRAIELGFNDITAKGIEMLSASLPSYNSLMYLYLDNNNMGCQGACHIAAVLNATKIHLLDLGFNKIGQQGIRALMSAVITNKSLTALVLSGNKLVLESVRAVAEAVELNSALKELYMDQTDMTLLGQTLIVSGLVNNKEIALRKMTGFAIGEIAAGLQVPALTSYVEYAFEETVKENHFRRREMVSLPPTKLENCNNELVLSYIRGMWKRHEQDIEDDIWDAEPTSTPPPFVSSHPVGSPGLSELQFGDVFDDDVDSSHSHNSTDHLAATIATTRQNATKGYGGLAGGLGLGDESVIKTELDRIAAMPFAAAEFAELRRHFFNEVSDIPKSAFTIIKPPSSAVGCLSPSSPFSASPPLKRARNRTSDNCQICLYPNLLAKVRER
jgi:hypothetical protein